MGHRVSTVAGAPASRSATFYARCRSPRLMGTEIGCDPPPGSPKLVRRPPSTPQPRMSTLLFNRPQSPADADSNAARAFCMAQIPTQQLHSKMSESLAFSREKRENYIVKVINVYLSLPLGNWPGDQAESGSHLPAEPAPTRRTLHPRFHSS